MINATRINYRRIIPQEAAIDIPDESYVNLGIGLPTQIVRYLDPERNVMIHSENGVLGVGPAPNAEFDDPDLVDAGKAFITLRRGGCFFHHADSFAMIRGGHIDIAVLGAYEVSRNGDLANWNMGDGVGVPAVGGAMDLVAGVSQVWILTTLYDKRGKAKIVDKCSLPITGEGVVSRIYTEVGLFIPSVEGLVLSRTWASVDVKELSRRLGLDIKLAN